MLRTNAAGVALIKRWEGLKDGDPDTPGLDPYLCPAGYWTIGYGRVVRDRNGNMLRGAANRRLAYSIYPDGITLAEAEQFLQEDLRTYEDAVHRFVRVPLNINQFSALVSLVYNIGPGAFHTSTLLRLLNAGDYAGAREQFHVWRMGTVNGVRQILPGLVKRRAEEAELFAEPVPGIGVRNAVSIDDYVANFERKEIEPDSGAVAGRNTLLGRISSLFKRSPATTTNEGP